MKMNKCCSDKETRAAYFDGLLPPAEEAEFLAALRSCPECVEMVAALGFVIGGETEAWKSTSVPAAVTARAKALWPTSPDPVSQAMRLAVKWIGDALSPIADALQPMGMPAVAMRGAAALARRARGLPHVPRRPTALAPALLPVRRRCMRCTFSAGCIWGTGESSSCSSR